MQRSARSEIVPLPLTPLRAPADAGVGRLERTYRERSDLMRRYSTAAVLLTIAFPFLCGLLVSGLLKLGNASFWSSIGPEDSVAGAMMGLAEFAYVLVAYLSGCIVGMLGLIAYAWRQDSFSRLQIVALLLNGAPLVVFTWLALARGQW
jgi:hypothetical protein